MIMKGIIMERGTLLSVGHPLKATVNVKEAFKSCSRVCRSPTEGP